MLEYGPVPWDRFDYGLGHARPNLSPKAVFLGMKIDSPGGICQAQVCGWKWWPQRYIQWSSVHTVVHQGVSLANRAGTITNTMQSFRKAIRYYAAGLAARGFHANALRQSSFAYLRQRWRGHPHLRHEYEQWFQEFMAELYAWDPCGPFQQPPRSQRSQPQSQRQPGRLLCGLYTNITVLQGLNQDSLVRQRRDHIDDELATAEADIRSFGDAWELPRYRADKCGRYIRQPQRHSSADQLQDRSPSKSLISWIEQPLAGCGKRSRCLDTSG